MAIDLEKILRAALQAALDDGSASGPRARPSGPGDHHRQEARKRRSGVRSVLVGAGLMAGGRMIVRRRGHEWLAAIESHLQDDDSGPADAEANEEE